MFTSHYGPRQGIYQSMESFRTPNWRASQFTVLNKVYRYKANTRIMTPPNSFPARSLTKRPNFDYRAPVSTSSLVQLAISKTISSPPPVPPRQTASAPPRPPPRSPACTAPIPSSGSRPKPRPSPKAHTIPSNRPFLSSLTSKTAEIHPRPSLKSQMAQRSSTAFPYPDPTKVREVNAAFAARLVCLARLECETVQQEAFGSRQSSHNRTQSTTSLDGTTTKAIYVKGKKLPPRPKSARTLRRTKAEASKVPVGSEESCGKPAEVAVKEDSYGQSDLSSSVLCVEVEEESTSDLGVSIESLCVSEEAIQVTAGMESGRHKQAWLPQEEEKGGTREAKGKVKTIYKSSSSCSLKGHKTSARKRKRVKSAKTRKK